MRRRSDIVSYSADELRAMRARGEGRSDWSKVDAIPEKELERLVAEEGEEGELVEGWAETIEIGMPRPKIHMNLRIDADVVDWFRAQGSGYQTRMNAVLRAFMEARRRFERS
ncbi:MAG TPA: BrnA antitoxin family protein [Rhodospirillales bacterium]|nr:BrnA antitoxin family protein [Rhodospirillales bacterium]